MKYIYNNLSPALLSFLLVISVATQSLGYNRNVIFNMDVPTDSIMISQLVDGTSTFGIENNAPENNSGDFNMLFAEASWGLGYGIEWTDLINITVNADNSLTKSGGSGWIAGSASQNILDPGKDGWIEFAAGETGSHFMIGLSRENKDANYTGIDHAIFLNKDGELRIFEKGSLIGVFGYYQKGDLLKIGREGEDVKYYRNGTLLHTTVSSSATPLLIDASLYAGTIPVITSSFNTPVQIKGVVTPGSLTGNDGSISLTVEGGVPPYTYSWSSGESTPSIDGKPRGTYSVTVTGALGSVRTKEYLLGYDIEWTDLINTTVNADNSLTKSGGSGWSAGSASKNVLDPGKDGWIEFIAGETGSHFMIGLSRENKDASYTGIDHAIYLHMNGELRIFESGSLVGAFGYYQEGDLLKVGREGEEVKYYRNGSLLHTTASSSATPLLIDASLSIGTIPVVTSSFGRPIDNIVEGKLQALRDLYQNTAGSSWTNNTGWPTDWNTITSIDQVVGWHGITVTNGDITGIDLTNNNLTGSIPESINQLTSLKTLLLQGNQLTGGIPDLSALSGLEDLQMSNNSLGGAIPSWITSLTKLKKLNLENCNLSGEIPANIGNLSNLDLLNLRINKLTGTLPASINNLHQLIHLRVDVNQLTGTLPELGNLVNLQLLDLNRNQFTGEIPVWVGNLNQLKYIRLWNNGFTGTIPANLGNLSQLAQLHLSYCNLSGSIPPEIAKLPKLKYLYLKDNKLVGAVPEFPATSVLSEIDLSGNKITSIPVLKNLSGITKVLVAGTWINFTDLEKNKPDAGTPQYTTFIYSPPAHPDNEISIAIGGDAEVINNRSGGINTVYQWTVWDGSTWTALSGKTNENLTINNVDESYNGKRYRCTMTNSNFAGLELYSSVYVVGDINDPAPADFDLKPLYNGNITSMNWGTAQPEGDAGERFSGVYLFGYDEKYQLKEAVWGQKIGGSIVTNTNKYRLNNISYDANGNIKTLRRYDDKSNKKHDFTYDYNQKTGAALNNQLEKIDGHASYHYNEIGQLTSEIGDDGTEKYVEYDVTGKVTAVYADAAKKELKVSYKYDDRGFRLMSRNEETAIETWYIRDASGNVMSIYEKNDDVGELVQKEVTVYGSGKVGVYYPQEDGTMAYEMTDHLGNVRAVVKKRRTTFTATMEDNGMADYSNPRVEEMQYFQNLFETEYKNTMWLNHTGTEVVNDPQISALLDGSAMKMIGPATTLIVEPGDKISQIKAYGVFEIQETYNHMALADVVAALATTYININGVEAMSQLETIFGGALTGFASSTGDSPDAYLNYIIFDEAFGVIGQDRVRIAESGGFVAGREHEADFYELKFDEDIEITENGYVYVYVSNESPGSKVWFDDVSVTLTEKVITQATDYYPFGSVMRRSNTPNAYVEGNLKPSLKGSVVAQFDFDGNTNDQSGNGNVALAYGGSYTTDADGNANSAYALDGVDDYLQINDHSSLDFEANDFAVSTWVRKNKATLGNSDNVALIGQWNTGAKPGTNSWLLAIGKPNMGNLPRIIVESGTERFDLSSNKAINLNEWYNIICMRKGNKLSLYVNGDHANSMDIGNVAINNVNLPIYIGRLHVDGYNSEIDVDDIHIFNRALDLTEIRNLSERKSLEEIDEVANEQLAFGGYYRYGYQGEFAEEDSETGWNSFELRMYDAVIGRFVVPDPMREFASPYVGMGNNPMNLTDPTGGCTDCQTVDLNTDFSLLFGFNRARMAAGVPVNGSIGWIQGMANWAGEAMGGFNELQNSFTSGVTDFFVNSATALAEPQTYADAAVGFMTTTPEQRFNQTVADIGNYITNLPNKSLSSIAYDAGYATGPAALSVALRGVGSAVSNIPFTTYARSSLSSSLRLHPRLLRQMDAGHRGTSFFRREIIMEGKFGVKNYNTLYINHRIGNRNFSIGINPWTRTIFHEAPGTFK